MKFSIVGIILLLFQLSVWAQEISCKPSAGTSPAKNLLQNLQLQQDSRIDSLLLRYVEINKRREGTDGFRVEIYFSSGTGAREEALKVKTAFLKAYPDETAYMSFQSPNFKVRVGDCRTKNEALSLKEKISRNYPNAFIVPDIIQFPKLYTDTKQQ